MRAWCPTPGVGLIRPRTIKVLATGRLPPALKKRGFTPVPEAGPHDRDGDRRPRGPRSRPDGEGNIKGVLRRSTLLWSRLDGWPKSHLCPPARPNFQAFRVESRPWPEPRDFAQVGP